MHRYDSVRGSKEVLLGCVSSCEENGRGSLPGALRAGSGGVGGREESGFMSPIFIEDLDEIINNMPVGIK